MTTPFVPRAPVLPSPRQPGEQGRRSVSVGNPPARGFQVLQSRREPSQLCLFFALRRTRRQVR